MSVPDYQEFMLPILQACSDEKPHTSQEIRNLVADSMGISEKDQNELLPSGKQSRFSNRVAWAKIYLQRAKLLESPERGVVFITDRGIQVLKNNPERIDNDFLKKYPEFVNFQSGKTNKNDQENESEKPKTPQETIDEGYQNLRQELIDDILVKLKAVDPYKFERIVVELLVKMGYGGTLKDAGQAVGKSGDGGIDGIIKEDRLGLDAIYIQAKKWEGNVSRPEIQKFAGALQGQRAKKGIFITTSSYSSEARDFVKHIDSKIILIDGEEMANYMIDFNLGVSIENTYEIKKIDSDYFSED